MALKKKTIVVIRSSGATPPMPAWTGDVADTSGGGDQDRPHNPDTRSQASGIVRSGNDGPHATVPKDGVALPTGGTETSKGRRTTPRAHVQRSSQLVRDEQHRDVEDPGRCHGKSPQRHSQDVQGRHARHDAGEKGARPRNRDGTPSNIVRSRSSSHSSRLSLPPT